MNILQQISSFIISTAISLSIISTPTVVPNLGLAVPTTPALYDGYLASSITRTDTSMTLSTGTVRGGTTLSGFICFTIDVNQPTVEYVCGTASGTSVTDLMRGVDVLNPNSTSTSLAYAHRRFASVSISDYPTIQHLVRKINGTDTLDSAITYTSSVSTSTVSSNGQNLASVAYVNSLSFGAIPPASESASGFSELSTQIEAASSTSTGGTGARLVLGGNLATSTYNSATAALRVVVTKNSGKIDDNFISTSTLGLFNNTVLTGTTTMATSTSYFTNGIRLIEIGRNMQVITTLGTSTFSVPSGVTKVKVRLVGGGAGGQTSTASVVRAAGGGAGGYAEKNVNVSGTTSIQVYVGSGGPAGTAGQQTKFGTNGFYFYATGGSVAATTDISGGGQGGIGTNGDLNVRGGTGLSGMGNSTSFTTGSSGFGGASYFGGEGAYGSGGTGGANGAGATGYDGVIIIEY